MDETLEWAPQVLEIEKTSYTTEEFYDWFKEDRLRLSSDFQRGEVWKTPAKSFLIDTMLRGFPIPPLHIRLARVPGTGLVREVIDGQQRLTAVIQYLEGRYSLTRYDTVEDMMPPWAGKKFAQLEPGLQARIRDYSFRCELYKGQIDDLLVREIFSRINIYSVPLNDQELRNGKYFGAFKQAVYELAREHESFWVETGIFTKTSLARMLDAQFVSESLIAEMIGQQDKKKMLDWYYHHYEEQWRERQEYSNRFRTTIDAIRTAVGETLKDTAFRRPPLFYTLFVVVYHRLYGLDQTIPMDEPPLPSSPIAGLDEAANRGLANALTFLSNELESEGPDPRYADFRKASSRQTDNIRPRLVRFRTLWNEADLSTL